MAALAGAKQKRENNPMHSSHQAEIIDLLSASGKTNNHLLRRAKQGQNGMMAVGRLVAPNSAVMRRLDRGIRYAAASRFNHRRLQTIGSPG
ncbi:hypothetical protein IVA80_12670 [Bradyrhizobium sp. 139]|uniref:hypothetical protein n=1 Tax=Bradyrhizobium sp. 139 TaxID=2782616 RepID=UPI001FFA4AC7|nr:hypothetical protein [Bradyrhizobium sp. 139]MCK1741702.1 hypothetical protein [Bradyrhizobium sp. 139]